MTPSGRVWVLRRNGNLMATCPEHIDEDRAEMLVAQDALHPDGCVSDQIIYHRFASGDPLPHGYTLTLESLALPQPVAAAVLSDNDCNRIWNAVQTAIAERPMLQITHSNAPRIAIIRQALQPGGG